MAQADAAAQSRMHEPTMQETFTCHACWVRLWSCKSPPVQPDYIVMESTHLQELSNVDRGNRRTSAMLTVQHAMLAAQQAMHSLPCPTLRLEAIAALPKREKEDELELVHEGERRLSSAACAAG